MDNSSKRSACDKRTHDLNRISGDEYTRADSDGTDKTAGDFACGWHNPKGSDPDTFDCANVFKCEAADEFDCVTTTQFKCGTGEGNDTFACGKDKGTTRFECDDKDKFTCSPFNKFSCINTYVPPPTE